MPVDPVTGLPLPYPDEPPPLIDPFGAVVEPPLIPPGLGTAPTPALEPPNVTPMPAGEPPAPAPALEPPPPEVTPGGLTVEMPTPPAAPTPAPPATAAPTDLAPAVQAPTVLDGQLVPPELRAPAPAATAPGAAAQPAAARALTPEEFATRAAGIGQRAAEDAAALVRARNQEAENLRVAQEAEIADAEEVRASAKQQLDADSAKLREMEEKGEPGLTPLNWVGLVLLALGSAMDRTGKTNAFAMAQQVLQQRSQAWAARLASAEKRVGRSTDAVADAAAQAQRIRQVGALKLGQLNEQLAQQLDVVAANAKSDQAKFEASTAAQVARQQAAAANAAAEIEAQERLLKVRADEREEARLRLAERAERRQSYGQALADRRARADQAIRRQELDLRAQELEAKGQEKQAQLVRENGVMMPDGTVMTLRKPEEAVRVDKQISSARALVAALDRMQQLRQAHGMAISDKTAEAQRAVAAFNNAKLVAKDFFELGAITESDAELIEGILGKPGTTVIGRQETWDETRANLVDKLNADLKQVTQGQWKGRWEPEPPGEARVSRRDARALLERGPQEGDDPAALVTGYTQALRAQGRGWEERAYRDLLTADTLGTWNRKDQSRLSEANQAMSGALNAELRRLRSRVGDEKASAIDREVRESAAKLGEVRAEAEEQVEGFFAPSDRERAEYQRVREGGSLVDALEMQRAIHRANGDLDKASDVLSLILRLRRAADAADPVPED